MNKLAEKNRSKKYKELAGKIDKSRVYSLEEGLNLIASEHKLKFTPSVEMHIRLGIDPKQADQQIRTSITLPKAIAKDIRIAVLTSEANQKAAKDAGAQIYKDSEILDNLSKNIIDFDVLIASADKMLELGKYAKLLGPKGLMPSPKSGTVTNDFEKIINELKAGKLEVRNDSYGIVHLRIGKTDFKIEDLMANARLFFKTITSLKPSSSKGTYIKSVTICGTMSPSIAIDQKTI